MRLFNAILECPHCGETCEHRVMVYGDGTALAWCSACHNPVELLISQLRARQASRLRRQAAE